MPRLLGQGDTSKTVIITVINTNSGILFEYFSRSYKYQFVMSLKSRLHQCELALWYFKNFNEGFSIFLSMISHWFPASVLTLIYTERKRKFSFMFVVYSLIFCAYSLISFRFHLVWVGPYPFKLVVKGADWLNSCY